CGRHAGTPQVDHAIAEGAIIAELLIFLDWTTDFVPGLQAAEPADGNGDPLRSTADAHGDPLDQAADEGLPVLDRGVGVMPHLRYLGGQSLDGSAIGGGQFARRLGPEAVILLLQLALLPQGLLPASLQLASDQAVLGLDGVILPRRALGLDPRP